MLSAPSFGAENLAAGASYECVIAPNYWGWKNPNHSDNGQLTDGVIVETWATERGAIYSLPSSLGWMSTPPVIVFDLGESKAIGGVGLHTVLSLWGPWWPSELNVLVSDDAIHYRLAAATFEPVPGQLDPPLTPETVQFAADRVLPDHGLAPSTHWYRTRGLRAKGRYIALLMTLPAATGAVVFDEVEIYADEKEYPYEPFPSPVFSEGKAGWKTHRLYRALEERFSRDLAGLRQQIEVSDMAGTAKEPLLKQVDRLSQEAALQSIPATDSFQAVYPVTDFHAGIFALQATLWRESGIAAVHAWKTHRWDPLDPIALPLVGKPGLRILTARNAVRSDVLNLSNAAAEPMTIDLTLDDLPAGHIELFEVPFVDTHSFQPVASALVPATKRNGGYRITVPSGMTRQLWVRFSSRDLEPGKREGTIRLTAKAADDAAWTKDVPVFITVADVTLPNRLSLRLGGWDYAAAGQYQVTGNNKRAYVEMLNEYGVNATWVGGGFPLGTHDDADRMVAPAPRENVETWLSDFPDAAFYCVAASFGSDRSETFVREWARDWAGFFSSMGIAGDQVAVLIRDEPNTLEELEAIHRFGLAIKEGAPGFKIFNDIHFPNPLNAPPLLDDVMRETCDIQCFNVSHFLSAPDEHRAFKTKYGREDLEWWCYTGGQAHRLSDPYVAWLLRPWFCFKEDVTGANWWAFGDGHGGFSWNEYFNAGTTRSPLYLGPDSVISSKSMEAMREGAQDYELLRMLREKTPGHDILEGGVERALATHTIDQWMWNVPKNRSVADAVREQVLSLLSAER
jgi:hypothetical protein